jgi:hypothetical protein
MELPHTADIEAEAPVGVSTGQTAMGGADRTAWVPVEYGVPCLFSPRSLDVSSADDRAQQRVVGVVYFMDGDPVAGGLTSKHRITVGGCPRAADNGTYSVVGAKDINAMGRVLEVQVERVRGR